jgi:Spy/CpxP family protein refolding chaperone
MNSKTTSRTILLTAVMAASLLIMQAPVYSGYGAKDGEGMKAQWKEKIAAVYEKLGLTPEQKEQLQAHKEKHRAEAAALREEVRVKRDEIRQELQKTDFDVNKVQQLHSELKVLKNGKEDHRLNGILEVRQILTAEQFARFMELKNKKDWKSKGYGHGENPSEPKGSQ